VYCYYPDISFHDNPYWIWECLPYYDCLFTTKSFHLSDPKVVNRVRDIRCVLHGYAADVDRMSRVPEESLRFYECDVCFVGQWSRKKEERLAALIGRYPSLNLKIWGPNWEVADPAVRRYWMGRGAYGDETVLVYRSSKICLGLLSERGTGATCGDQTTARTWQIPAVSGFLLHEWTPELAQHFEVGKEACAFRDDETLCGCVGYYLAHENERLAVAEAGHSRVRVSHCSYADRMREIVAYHLSRVGGREPREQTKRTTIRGAEFAPRGP
jgi:spore maturation protein CgeB